MNRKEKIHSRYKKGAFAYDSLLSTKSVWSKLACKMVWGFPDTAYAGKLLDWIPNDFSGRLLDVPVGTALFTASKYKRIKNAEIICLDYSEDMMQYAEERFKNDKIGNITCRQGDVGALPFEDNSFDIVLSMNGFHAFPDKEAAFREIERVVKPNGSFIGCFYIKGEVTRTDWVINRFYVPKGYFTPPFMTKNELEQKLQGVYSSVELWNIGSIVCFRCVKGAVKEP